MEDETKWKLGASGTALLGLGEGIHEAYVQHSVPQGVAGFFDQGLLAGSTALGIYATRNKLSDGYSSWSRVMKDAISKKKLDIGNFAWRAATTIPTHLATGAGIENIRNLVVDNPHYYSAGDILPRYLQHGGLSALYAAAIGFGLPLAAYAIRKAIRR